MKTITMGLLLAALLAGCVSADRLNDVRIGMTKDQVISLLGKPDSMSAQGTIEYLTYYLVTDNGYGRDVPYSVRLVNGKVESFGRFAQLSDIYMRPVDGSPPQINLGLPYAATPPAPKPDLATQLQTLKTLKDQGALTEEQFEKAKQKLLAGSN